MLNKGDIEINRHRIIIIEFLSSEDIVKTGKALYDNILCYKKSESVLITGEYYPVSSKEEFINQLLCIYFSYREGEFITIDIESHGDEEGIGINGIEFLSWKYLYDYLRMINVKCGGLLVVTFSCCYGLAQVAALNPRERSPFFAFIASSRKMKPYELYNGFSKFFEVYNHPLELGKAIDSLNLYFTEKGIDSPFLSATSVALYDEFFSEERIEYIASLHASALAKMEGIDDECAKYQIIEDMKEDWKKFRPYFNFFDVMGIEECPV